MLGLRSKRFYIYFSRYYFITESYVWFECVCSGEFCYVYLVRCQYCESCQCLVTNRNNHFAIDTNLNSKTEHNNHPEVENEHEHADAHAKRLNNNLEANDILHYFCVINSSKTL